MDRKGEGQYMEAQMLFSCAKELLKLITDSLNTRAVGSKRTYPNTVTYSDQYLLRASCPSRKSRKPLKQRMKYEFTDPYEFGSTFCTQ